MERGTSGYSLKRLFATEQTYRLRSREDVAGSEDAEVMLEWDWRITGEFVFAVTLGIRIPAAEGQPHEVRAVMVAEFEVVRDKGDVPAFREFCTIGASAIIFPFVREAIASMTTRSIVKQALLLPPTNLQVLLADIDFEGSTGTGQLPDHPEFRELLGRE